MTGESHINYRYNEHKALVCEPRVLSQKLQIASIRWADHNLQYINVVLSISEYTFRKQMCMFHCSSGGGINILFKVLMVLVCAFSSEKIVLGRFCSTGAGVYMLYADRS